MLFVKTAVLAVLGLGAMTFAAPAPADASVAANAATASAAAALDRCDERFEYFENREWRDCERRLRERCRHERHDFCRRNGWDRY